jgi:hypothetical protein
VNQFISRYAARAAPSGTKSRIDFAGGDFAHDAIHSTPAATAARAQALHDAEMKNGAIRATYRKYVTIKNSEERNRGTCFHDRALVEKTQLCRLT